MNYPLNTEEETHSLLETPTPAYSNVTVRRAFVVWMFGGQKNKFKDVCNYYHYLEALEDKLTPEQRASSRDLEFDLFTSQPPTSSFQMEYFPDLYAEAFTEKPQPIEESNTDKYDFKLEELSEITPKNGVTTQEIVETSRLIRKYCRMQAITLKSFLYEFKQHANKCELKYTVNNVAFYIKRKMVNAEVKIEASYPKTLGFLTNKVDELPTIVGTPNGTKECKESIANDKSVQNLNGNSIEDGSMVDASTNINSVVKVKSRSMKEAFEGVYPQIIDDASPEEEQLFLNGKSVSTEDLNDAEDFDLLPTKERRFSGSFEKMQLEKFRKI